MPESDSLASAQDIRESVIPPTWPEPSPMLYGRRASAGAVRDTISEEDARDLSDADLQAIRTDAISRWAERDVNYLRAALKDLDDYLAITEVEKRRRRRAWATIIGTLLLVGIVVIALLHWK